MADFMNDTNVHCVQLKLPLLRQKGIQFVAIVVCNNQSKFIRKFTKHSTIYAVLEF